MRRTAFLPALVGMMFVVAALGIGAKPIARVRKTLTTRYEKIDLAASRKDVNGATAYCTRDFVAVGPTGAKSTLPEQRDNMQKTFRAMGPARFTTRLLQLRVSGRTAVVTVSSHVVTTLLDPKTHRKRQFAASQIGQDTWVRTRVGWLLSRNEALSAKTGFTRTALSARRRARPGDIGKVESEASRIANSASTDSTCFIDSNSVKPPC